MYKALEQGEINDEWLVSHLAGQVPQQGLCYFSLDGSAWPRRRARTMDDKQYVYLPTPAVNGGSICIGHPYSLLDWVPEPQSSWSLSVNVSRIPSTQSAKLVGIEQVKALNEARKPYLDALDIVAADGNYGDAQFLRPLKGQRCGIVLRLRKDRVQYRKPDEPKSKSRGRPHVYGERFAFKEPDTWGALDEVLDLDHPHWGQVRLESWNNLHGKRDTDVPFDILRSSVHLERDKPPRPVWLARQTPATTPKGFQLDTAVIWQAYSHR